MASHRRFQHRTQAFLLLLSSQPPQVLLADLERRRQMPEMQRQQQLQTALDLSRSGQRTKAIESLIKAFKTNPNYRLESYALNTAASITGLSKGDFLAGLEDENRLQGIIKQMNPQPEKKKNKSNFF